MERGFPRPEDFASAPSSLLGFDLAVLLAMAACGGWIYFRYAWLPHNRPGLYRAMLLRNKERRRRDAERRAGMLNMGGFAARLIANRLGK
jgi:hypothetical protein